MINLRLGTRRIGWRWQHPHDEQRSLTQILSWAMPGAQRLADDSPLDFMVLVGWGRAPLPAWFNDFHGLKFLVAGEPNLRYPAADNCYTISNGRQPGDDQHVRYGPILCYWCAPIAATVKFGRCVLIDSGKWKWRARLCQKLAETVGPIDILGRGVGRPLPGYHGSGDGKQEAIAPFAFNLALESFELLDYWTEKIGDPILCESVPVYHGAQNIDDYFIPESLVLFSEARKVNWDDWPAEYSRRHPAVLAQKEFIRTRFNVFSYFDRLTSDLALLDQHQPITRSHPA